MDAIRKSGGAAIYSDLENIKVTRVNSISKEGGKIGTKFNLIKAIDLEDNSQNIRLDDGDTISIYRSEKPLISQI